MGPNGLGRHWAKAARLSSVLAHANAWIEARGTERGPWLSVAFAAGICAWVVLPGVFHWLAFLAALGGILLLVLPRDRDGRLAYLRLAVLSVGLMAMAGCATIWIKSSFLGTPPLPRPLFTVVEGTVVNREVQAAQAIIANARSVMLVADGTKLRRSAPVRIGHIGQVQTFVTDAALPDALQAICDARGVKVIAAMPRSSCRARAC